MPRGKNSVNSNMTQSSFFIMGKKRGNPFRIIISVMLLAILTLAPLAMAASSKQSVLGIFGNANGDDVIDMRDVTCIERIILGLAPEVQLADAMHDGKIDIPDVTQTELIIAGRDRVLSLLDERGEVINVRKPVKRVIPEHITSFAAMRALGAQEKIISIGSTAIMECMGRNFLQDFAGFPTIGKYGQPDYEAILGLNPDLLIAYRCSTLQEKLPGVTVFYAGYGAPYPAENFDVDVRKLGYILDKTERAEAYIKWYNNYLHFVEKRVSGLLEEEKPRVYVYYPLTGLYMCKGNYSPVEIAGGINIGAGLGPGFATTVDPEWVIKQNPDIIIGTAIPNSGAYETDDASELKAEREKVLHRPELANITAVKEKRVYFINAYALGLYPNYLLAIVYYAKWLHPDLFKDLDPKAVHQEYLDRFQGIDFDVRAHGVFNYPLPK